VGGVLFDGFGYRATFGLGAVLLVAAAVLAGKAARA
jgi:predicted MFS family arabinose efflux permease